MSGELKREPGPVETFRAAFDGVMEDFLTGHWQEGYEPTAEQFRLMLEAAQAAQGQGVTFGEIRSILMIPNVPDPQEGLDQRLSDPQVRHRAMAVFRSHLAMKLASALKALGHVD